MTFWHCKWRLFQVAKSFSHGCSVHGLAKRRWLTPKGPAGRLMGGFFPCRFFVSFLWPAARRPGPPAAARPSAGLAVAAFVISFEFERKMHNRLRTSNDSWDLRTETSKFGGTQASSMEAACVPVVFRQKCCAYRDFWRFLIETLPLDRRANAKPGIRGSQADY